MLAAGTDPRAEPSLHYAAEHGHLDVCRALLTHDRTLANQANGDASPLLHAAAVDNVPICELLLAHGADVNGVKKGTRPIDVAINAFAAGATAVLLRAGAKPNDALPADITALCAKRFLPELAQICVDRGWESSLRDESRRSLELSAWFAARDARAAAGTTLKRALSPQV